MTSEVGKNKPPKMNTKKPKKKKINKMKKI